MAHRTLTLEGSGNGLEHKPHPLASIVHHLLVGINSSITDNFLIAVASGHSSSPDLLYPFQYLPLPFSSVSCLNC